VVKSLAKIPGQTQGDVKHVRLLGYSGKLDWKQTAEGLAVTLPAQRPCEHAFAFEITGEGLTPVNP
jgi:alpha-L-fucosidase